MKRPRASRPLTSHFSPQALGDRWRAFANQKKPSLKMDGSWDPADNRAMAADIAGLKMHDALLEPLVYLARSGFPAHGDLRQTVLILNQDLDILGVEPQFAFSAANDTADR